ncbi:MAG: bifunctional nuclease family protein [Gemmatimonadota bacterium]
MRRPGDRLSYARRGLAVLVEVRVQSLGLDRTTNNPVVILREHGGERVLPIWIGPGEASAIAMQLADWSFSRPLTHDLLVSVLGGLGGSLERVIITQVVENTYFAELIIQRNGGVFSVDARPSDSIAVALRVKAKIFAEEALLERATVEIAEEESVTLDSEDLQDPNPQEIKTEDLKEYLKRLNPEDFGRFTP